jgi:protein O-GlcNAc transferase
VRESPSTYNRIGMTLGQRGRLPEAIEAFERALALKPDFAPAYHNLGLAWWKLGHVGRAMAGFRRAIELDPTNVEPYCGLGQALVAEERDHDAVEVLKRAVAELPRSHKAHFTLGAVFERVLAWEKAAASYRKSIDLYPLHADAYVRLARLSLFMLDRPDEALAALTTALELAPDDARVRAALDETLDVVVR